MHDVMREYVVVLWTVKMQGYVIFRLIYTYLNDI